MSPILASQYLLSFDLPPFPYPTPSSYPTKSLLSSHSPSLSLIFFFFLFFDARLGTIVAPAHHRTEIQNEKWSISLLTSPAPLSSSPTHSSPSLQLSPSPPRHLPSYISLICIMLDFKDVITTMGDDRIVNATPPDGIPSILGLLISSLLFLSRYPLTPYPSLVSPSLSLPSPSPLPPLLLSVPLSSSPPLPLSPSPPLPLSPSPPLLLSPLTPSDTEHETTESHARLLNDLPRINSILENFLIEIK